MALPTRCGSSPCPVVADAGGSLLFWNKSCAGGRVARPGALGSAGAQAVSLGGAATGPKMGLSGCHCGLPSPSSLSRRPVLTGPYASPGCSSSSRSSRNCSAL
eukprot:14424564-Alexandrium_andersonii.AAC.1